MTQFNSTPWSKPSRKITKTEKVPKIRNAPTKKSRNLYPKKREDSKFKNLYWHGSKAKESINRIPQK